MMYTPKVITDSTTEPVTASFVKLHAAVDNSVEDSLFDDMWIPAARRYFEFRTGYTIHQKTLEMVYDKWPSDKNHIALIGATPLISVTSVKYKDSDGTETTWSTDDYIVDTDQIPGRVVLAYGETWPSFTAYPSNPIRIRYVAGIATASPITEAPGDIKMVVALLTRHFYDNRQAVQISDRGITFSSDPLKYAVEAFLQPYMQWRF